MANYSRASVNISYGATSSLQDPDFDIDLISTPSEPSEFDVRKLSCATGGTTIKYTNFSTIEELFIENQDSTNYVTVTYVTDAIAGSQSIRVKAGQWVKLALVDDATDVVVTANTAACICRLIAIGV